MTWAWNWKTKDGKRSRLQKYPASVIRDIRENCKCERDIEKFMRKYGISRSHCQRIMTNKARIEVE